MYSQGDAPKADPKKLFVGNLPYSVTEDQLRDIFSEFGDLEEVKLLTDRATGRSRGIAFVKFADEASAQAAIEKLHESDLEGRNMIVNVARPRVPRDNNSYGNNRGGGYNRNNGGGGYNNDRY